jgi:hypothetical protein
LLFSLFDRMKTCPLSASMQVKSRRSMVIKRKPGRHPQKPVNLSETVAHR